MRERKKYLLYAEIEVTKPTHWITVGNRKTSEELISYLRSKSCGMLRPCLPTYNYRS